MNRNRLAKKTRWTSARERRYRRRVDRNFADYWKGEVGYGTAPVPGRLLAKSKLRGARAGRKAGAR